MEGIEHREGIEAGKTLLSDLEELKARIKTGDPESIKEGFLKVFGSKAAFQYVLLALEATEFENFARQIVSMNTWIDIAYNHFNDGRSPQVQHIAYGIKAVKRLVELLEESERAWNED